MVSKSSANLSPANLEFTESTLRTCVVFYRYASFFVSMTKVNSILRTDRPQV